MSLFDPSAREAARARARRIGGDQFLYARAFEEMVERLDLLDRPTKRVLLVGALDPAFADQLRLSGRTVETLDSGGGDDAIIEAGRFDAVLVLGALDTVEELPALLLALNHSLRPDAPLLGAFLGGDSLAVLRRALIEADRAAGGAAARAHPRIDAPSFASLLQAAGFAMPVVDVDKIAVNYTALDRLVTDLRAMAATNMLNARPRFGPSKAWSKRLSDLYAAALAEGQSERFDLIHFLGWSPAAR